MSRAWLFIGLAGCAGSAAAPAPMPTASVAHATAAPTATVSESCRTACAHAVDLELDVVHKGYASAAERIEPARERYVADCTKHCADIDLACVGGATSVTNLAGCGKPKAPAYFMAVLDDVYPYDEYARAPRDRVEVFVYGYAHGLTIELPHGMKRAPPDMRQWEAPGDWMSPLSFRFEHERDLATPAAIRARYGTDHELDESIEDGRACVSSAREDGMHVYVACFVPMGAGGDGVACLGSAMKMSGWPSQVEVARFMRSVCTSLKLP